MQSVSPALNWFLSHLNLEKSWKNGWKLSNRAVLPTLPPAIFKGLQFNVPPNWANTGISFYLQFHAPSSCLTSSNHAASRDVPWSMWQKGRGQLPPISAQAIGSYTWGAVGLHNWLCREASSPWLRGNIKSPLRVKNWEPTFFPGIYTAQEASLGKSQPRSIKKKTGDSS